MSLASIDEVINNYKVFLEVKYPGHYKMYCTRLKDNPESAKAEAIMFSFLRTNFEDVKIAEDLGIGGVDFLCKSNGTEFVVEVTSLGAEPVAAQSGLKNEVPENGSGGSFGMITHMLRTRASSKADQLSKYKIPRILAITCEHIAAGVLLGPYGAETLLTSDTKIGVPIGKPADEVNLTTDLKNSVFFRFENGQLESCRRSISAILLCSIFADKSYIVGVLHPEPKYNLPINLFPSIPFVRMQKWPPENDIIKVEWVIHKPKAGEFYHQKVELKDQELRSK